MANAVATRFEPSQLPDPATLGGAEADLAVQVPADALSDEPSDPGYVEGEDGARLYAVEGMPMARLHRVGYVSVGLRRFARIRVAHFKPLGQALGTLVLMQGRAEYIEKYADVIARYVRLGFWVVAFDWRGQGLSTRILRDEPRKGHIHEFDAYVRDAQLVIEKAVLPDCPLPLMGLAHSMGGLIALHLMVRKPLWFDRMVLSAPLLRFNVGEASHETIATASKWASRFGFNQMYAPGSGDALAGTAAFEDNDVTSHQGRYARSAGLLAQYPELGLGGPTLGWLNQCARGMARIWNQAMLNRISTPCLFVQAGADTIVSPVAIERLAAAVPTATLVRLPLSKHEPMFETDAIRDMFFAASDAFYSVQEMREGRLNRSLENLTLSLL
ncbi:MAG: alpha/beta hydrolase [Devosiaceae bacterium]|nr:alpha/beta hydrolase [Devosiaceae bacterium MH13]